LPDDLNWQGKIAEEEIKKIPEHYQSVKIDHSVVMPNHIHMIVVLEKNDHNLNQIIAQYKSGVTRNIRKNGGNISVWQRSYHDHVIRDQKGYEKIWNYIEGNPMNWNKDCFYTDPYQTNRI
jgi:REP element-mobilizing transposase RayT